MVVDREGPILVEGPVEATTAEGDVVVSERFVVAVCACGRSRTYPWCDTSHRRREPGSAPAAADSSRTAGDAAGAVTHGAGGVEAAEAKDSES